MRTIINTAFGYSGYSGASSGTSGYSGYSGTSGYSGYSGKSGYSGYSGTSGYSGYSGKSGYSGYSGISGYSGSITTDGANIPGAITLTHNNSVINVALKNYNNTAWLRASQFILWFSTASLGGANVVGHGPITASNGIVISSVGSGFSDCLSTASGTFSATINHVSSQTGFVNIAWAGLTSSSGYSYTV